MKKTISVLPRFSQILERLMYNHLFKYLTENKIIYDKQLGFTNSNSAQHVVDMLLYQSE